MKCNSAAFARLGDLYAARTSRDVIEMLNLRFYCVDAPRSGDSGELVIDGNDIRSRRP